MIRKLTIEDGTEDLYKIIQSVQPTKRSKSIFVSEVICEAYAISGNVVICYVRSQSLSHDVVLAFDEISVIED